MQSVGSFPTGKRGDQKSYNFNYCVVCFFFNILSGSLIEFILPESFREVCK